MLWLHSSDLLAALPVLDELITGAAVAMALTAGALCLLRWRLTGEAPVLLIGSAIMLIGVFSIGIASLLPMLARAGVDTAGLSWSRLASMLVGFALLGFALTAPAVDARLRPRAVLLFALGAIAMLTALLQAPALSSALLARHVAESDAAGHSLIVAAGLLALAAAYWRAGTRRGRRLLLWIALSLLGLGLRELLPILTASPGGAPENGSALGFAALAIAVLGTIRELQWAYAEQSGRLLHSMATTQQVEQQMRAHEEADEERAHEARNALSAIEGATITLERYRDSIDKAARVSLESAISTEIARLQRLIAPSPRHGDPAPFDLAQTLAPLVTVERLAGALIECDVADGAVVRGRQTDVAEIVQNLLVNARRYASGSPVALRAHRTGDEVIVTVEDCGPGVAEHQRQFIFQRGARGDQSAGVAGSGLGLFISAQLARAQGGDLWVEERPGGGASFKLRLPAAEDSDGGGIGPDRRREHTVEDQHHLGEAVKLHALGSQSRADDPGADVARSVGQLDDDLGSEVGGRRG